MIASFLSNYISRQDYLALAKQIGIISVGLADCIF